LMRGCVFPNDQGSFDPWGRASEFLGSHLWPSDRSTQRSRRYIRGLGLRSWVSALTPAMGTDLPPSSPLPPPAARPGRENGSPDNPWPRPLDHSTRGLPVTRDGMTRKIASRITYQNVSPIRVLIHVSRVQLGTARNEDSAECVFVCSGCNWHTLRKKIKNRFTNKQEVVKNFTSFKSFSAKFIHSWKFLARTAPGDLDTDASSRP